VEDGRDPGPLRRALRPKAPSVVCFDEKPCQLLADVRDPLPMEPAGHPKKKRVDSEYERKGTAHVLLAFEPIKGRREISVTERPRKQEFAEMMRYLAEEAYPDADRIRLIVDNLRAPTRQQPSTRSSPLSRLGTSPKRSSSSTPLKARIVAEHGGDRALRTGQAVPEARHSGHRDSQM
jgi:DDE superfamily endonuclease